MTEPYMVSTAWRKDGAERLETILVHAYGRDDAGSTAVMVNQARLPDWKMVGLIVSPALGGGA